MKRTLIIIFLLSIVYQVFGQKDFSTNFYIYDNKGKLQQTIRYDKVKLGSLGFLIVSKDGKYGVYNYKQEKIVTELKYRDIDAIFKNGLALAKNKYGKLGLIDINNANEIILPFDYYKIFYLNDRYYSVTGFNRKTGVYDVIEKRFVIPCQFDSRIGLQDEVFIIKNQNEYALYGKKGEIVMPFQKQKFYLDKKNHLVNIHRNNSTLLFNTQSLKYQTEVEFKEFPIKFSNDAMIVSRDGRYGFLNTNGEMMTDFSFFQAVNFNEYGFAKVKKKNSWTVIDKTGKEILVTETIYESKRDCPDIKFDGIYLERISEELQGVKKLDGTWLIPPEYYFFFIKDGYITGQKKNQEFFLFDLDGNFIKSMPQNQTVEPVGKLYRYYNDGEFGWMNKRFKVKAKPGTAFLNDFEHPKFAPIYLDSTKKFGAVNEKGKIIIPLEYDYINTFDLKYNIAPFKKDGKWGVFNRKGKKIIAPIYSNRIALQDGWSIMVE